MAESRAHGAAICRATIRATPEDFFVDEELPFTPEGAGEHVLVQVEKRGHNTGWVAQQLARFAGIAPRDISFSGRKDRHAVTRQWFSLHMPGKADPDFSAFKEEGIKVLATHRHSRKLRTGTHRRNHFVLTLRNVDGDHAAIDARIAAIAARGVPNRFGEQRFGRDGGTLATAHAAVANGRLPAKPNLRGLVISALRSEIFNAVLGARVADGSWERLLPGEFVVLDGTGDRGFNDDGDPGLAARCAALDVHPSGPLAGEGGQGATGEALELESQVTGGYDPTLAALASWRVEGGRRALRSRVLDLVHDWPETNVLRLSFTLWRGCYATAVLGELGDIDNAQDVQSDAAGNDNNEND